MAANVACDSLHQYLRRHSSCDLAITHSGDPLSFSICQLSAWDSRENYRRLLENYKGQQKGAFNLFLFSLCKAFQVPAVCQLPDFLLPGWLHSSIIFHFNCFCFSPVALLPTFSHRSSSHDVICLLKSIPQEWENNKASDAEAGYYLDISMSTDHYLP